MTRHASKALAILFMCALLTWNSALAQDVAPSTAPATAASALEIALRAEIARPGGLVADDAARRAAATSLEARARGADVVGTQAEVDRANLGWIPRATLSARYTRLSDLDPRSFGPPGASLVATSAAPGPLAPGAPLTALPGSALAFPVVLDQVMTQANLVVPLSDYFLRVPQARDSATHAREAAKIGERAARRAAATQAKLAYYAWARAKLQCVVTRQSIEQTRQHLELVRAARDGGRANPADVLRAESLLASAELIDARAQSAAKLGEARLRTLMHDTRGVTFAIGEDLFQPVDPGGLGDAERLLVEARRLRPEFGALEATGASVKEQRSVARAAELPRLDLFANGYVANPSPRVVPQEQEWRATWDAGVQLSWSPNDLAGASPQARALDAKHARIEAERELLLDQIRDELTTALLSIEESRAALTTAERGLTAAEEAYRVRRETFALGRGTSVELVDAESEVLRARLETIQARLDARVAQTRLAHAVGW